MALPLLLLAAFPVYAATTMRAASVIVPGATLRKVDVNLATDPAGQLHLSLSIGRADIASMGWRNVGVQLQGQLLRSGTDKWSCQGTLQLRGAPGGLMRTPGRFKLILDVSANTLQLNMQRTKDQKLSLALPLDQLSHVQAQLVHVPLSWLQGPLEHAWSGRLTSGMVSGVLAMDFKPAGLTGSAMLSVRRAAFDGGSFAGQGVGLTGHLNFNVDGHRSRVGVSGSLLGGDILLGPVYATLPSRATQLTFGLTARGGSMRVDHLRYDDPDALFLSGGFVFGKNGSLSSISLNRFNAHFPTAYQRYGRTWLATLGLRNLKTAGDLEGGLVLGANGLSTLRLRAHSLDVEDAGGRFHVDGLDGALDWNHDGVRPQTTLTWQGLGMYRISLGSGKSQWRSSKGVLRLTSPLDIPVLGGKLGVQQFAWQPGAKLGNRVDVSATLTGVNMTRLSKALGWPAFRGTLGGAMPGLRYANGSIRLLGGLSLNVFDGFVDITNLVLTHPFGDTPELAADVSMKRLDLGAMTDVFDFGKITGRLHGRVDKLHLVDWKPVGFDGHLLADSGGRISQRAVNNLTAVGGGGIVGGLQGMVLKLFKSFGYSRIGLNCTLQGSTCHMSGLKPIDSGYLIVEGSGLPHLTVIGHQNRVSWPTLVSRLKAAIHGPGPVVK